MKNNLFTTLKEVLKKDDRFLSQDWYLLKNQIREKTNSLDEKLIELLLENEFLKKKFFKKVKNTFIFDINKFSQFINNKEFLADSYTSFKNKIWLTNKKWDYLANSWEIVLSWPYKDCTLAWWQTKEDAKRNEIFYNEILASDEIDRLLDEKVFTNFKRVNKDWEHKLDTFKRNKKINKARWLPEDTITDNLLIKWNNLLALHSLKSNFAWKIKLIYIDPPYNTWNDSFNYNDRFNHSTWLTFMKNRLEIAKELLKDDWVIFVQCDDNEQAYLKVLMDEIFWRENFIWNLIRKVWVAVRLDAKHISRETDYILFYTKNEDKLIVNKEKANNMESYPYSDTHIKERWKYKLNKLDRWSINYSDKMDYEIIAPDGSKIYPWWTSEKNWWCWRWSKDKLKWWIENDFIKIKKTHKWWNVYFKQYQFVDNNGNKIERANPYKNLLIDWFNNEIWNKELKNLFWKSNVFSFPKSEILLKRLLEMVTNPWDIVLDYHLWSGTTCAVAHKMGRQYIWIEQMDYIETISKERLKKVIEWEQGWISKNVKWKWWWEFVYMEIIQENEKFIKEIECAKNDEELLEIYETIKNNEFINYYVNIESIDENINDFKDLNLENKKRFLIELLDKNLLYKNYSEINDKNSWVSKEDKKMNKEFYN